LRLLEYTLFFRSLQSAKSSALRGSAPSGLAGWLFRSANSVKSRF